jgi:hypothetical protein
MKSNPEFKQKGKRIGAAGGFFNQLMSHNASVPVVGEGATILHYSDRDAYEVLEVNEDKKTCVIQKYHAKRIDENGMSDNQTYEYKELEGYPITLVYRWGGWKRVGEEVRFTDEAREHFGRGPKLHEAYQDAGGEYNGAFACTEIPNMTRKHKTYSPVNIIFGVKREYYDFSF